MRVISVEPTPNPAARAFRLDRRIVSGAPIHVEATETGANPIARRLFEFPGVRSVYLADDFVTVALEDASAWGDHEASIRAALDAALSGIGGAPIASETAAAAPSDDLPNDLLARINALLDARVRPALANDGGGLRVVGLEGRDLYISYQGACGGCPHAMMGTLRAIQNLLRAEVDPDLNVIPG